MMRGFKLSDRVEYRIWDRPSGIGTIPRGEIIASKVHFPSSPDARYVAHQILFDRPWPDKPLIGPIKRLWVCEEHLRHASERKKKR